MAEVTVKQLASVVGTPVERLLEQIKDAGLTIDKPESLISDADKMTLLGFLRGQHGKDSSAAAASKPGKIALKRKSVSEVKVSGSGRNKVSIEVRRKRSISRPVEPSVTASEDAMSEVEAPAEITELEKLRADQARREQERESERQLKLDRAEKRNQVQKEEDARLAEVKTKAEETSKSQPTKKESKTTGKEKSLSPDELQAQQARDQKSTSKKHKADHKDKNTLYGRKELHVSTGKSGKRQKKKGKTARRSAASIDAKHGFEVPVDAITHDVTVPDTITVDDLAKRMSMKAGELIKTLMQMGVMATINQVIDQDTAVLLIEELGHNPVVVNEDDYENVLLARDTSDLKVEPRPPVVTIMGHVDHGKTSLLDYIRSSKIAAGEAGGITQHIGAYHVDTDKGVITFLDTPGHAAFTSMRERGANATDIVIVVVAADDGVMPQTIEAVQHAKAAEVPIIIAVNKMDKEGADPDRVKTELGNYEIIPEEWGGDNIFINVSALTGDGVDKLLDAISLQAELMELQVTAEGLAKGVVLEASLDKGRGVTATVLVQEGTIKKGDIMLAGEDFGRVRAMFDEFGNAIDSAGPSMPAVIIGLSNTPNAGDDMQVLADERTAREVSQNRKNKARDMRLATQQANKLESMFEQMEAGEVKKLNVLLKADVQGTLFAISDSLMKLAADNDEVDVRIVGSGVGGINETDISLASASDAIVIGFNVRADAAARRSAAERGVELNYYSIIYELIDEVEKALTGMLKAEYREQIIGMAKVQEVFKSPVFGQVAGCLVTEGTIRKDSPIRVLRDNVVIFEGELESLRRFKDAVKEVASGTECGIGVKNYEVQVADQIEVFERIEVARKL
ncbi:Translation initiation factor 2 [hydrothermal vent metagenome]|uniref:Translation initiation factor 2 n=1 Tax=hydrothermal vent metagenome TaxID=652676 RepID=A0A3B0WL15_9ZZZZ